MTRLGYPRRRHPCDANASDEAEDGADGGEERPNAVENREGIDARVVDSNGPAPVEHEQHVEPGENGAPKPGSERAEDDSAHDEEEPSLSTPVGRVVPSRGPHGVRCPPKHGFLLQE